MKSKKEKLELLALLEKKLEIKRQKMAFSWYKSAYDWQREFVAATKEHFESLLMAGNQVGKSRTGCMIDAFHLTGDYPNDWVGHKFDHAPLIWCLGYSMEKTRDLLQAKLFGDYIDGDFQGGLVPRDKILAWESATGTPNAMRSVTVKHVNGKSKVQFWSYGQGQHAIMGDVVDWVHVDEEPRDHSIRPQLITRTTNGDRGKGGRIIYTFTPENGRTELVVQFMDNRTPDQFMTMVGWDRAPHITKEKAERMAQQFPAYQRDMRMKGIPVLGHGRIYEVADEVITCDPFEIPSHFKVIGGLDFGFDHPQAVSKIAYDPDSDIIYVPNSWKASKVSANDAWGSTKAWIENIPLSWPHDGLQSEKGRDDAVQQQQHYVNAGFRMLGEWATWPEGGNSVEMGILEILQRARTGRFKVFRGNNQFFDEWRQYHRREPNRDGISRIVKINDDILDATRYAVMMLRHAIYNGDRYASNSMLEHQQYAITDDTIF